MLGAVLLFGVLAGVDNLQVCSSIGLLPLDRRRHLLAVGFSLCEMAAPLLGLAMGHLLLGSLGGAAAKAGPVLMMLCGTGLLACRVLPPSLWLRLYAFMGQVANLRRVGTPPVDLCVSPPSAGWQPARRMPSCPTLHQNGDPNRRALTPGRPTRGSAADQGVRPTGQAGLTLLFGLPLSLSLDNLLGGAGISALGYPMVPAALLIGLVSAAMSCAGLYLGGWARGLVQWRGVRSSVLARCLEPAVGAYLCLLAVRLLIVSRS